MALEWMLPDWPALPTSGSSWSETGSPFRRRWLAWPRRWARMRSIGFSREATTMNCSSPFLQSSRRGSIRQLPTWELSSPGSAGSKKDRVRSCRDLTARGTSRAWDTITWTAHEQAQHVPRVSPPQAPPLEVAAPVEDPAAGSARPRAAARARGGSDRRRRRGRILSVRRASPPDRPGIGLSLSLEQDRHGTRHLRRERPELDADLSPRISAGPRPARLRPADRAQVELGRASARSRHLDLPPDRQPASSVWSPLLLAAPDLFSGRDDNSGDLHRFRGLWDRPFAATALPPPAPARRDP